MVEKLKQSLIEKYGDQIQANNNEEIKKEEPPVEQIQPKNESPKGRIFISLQLQEEHKDILKAKYHQEEHKGAKIPDINGIKPPAKLDIKEKFKKHQKERSEFVNALKEELKRMENFDPNAVQDKKIRQSRGDVEEEKQILEDENSEKPEEEKKVAEPVPPTPEEIEKMRNDIEQFENLNQKHEEMLEFQSQIHKGLQDMWRRKLLQQRQQEEKLKKEEEEAKKGGKKKP